MQAVYLKSSSRKRSRKTEKVDERCIHEQVTAAGHQDWSHQEIVWETGEHRWAQVRGVPGRGRSWSLVLYVPSFMASAKNKFHAFLAFSAWESVALSRRDPSLQKEAGGLWSGRAPELGPASTATVVCPWVPWQGPSHTWERRQQNHIVVFKWGLQEKDGVASDCPSEFLFYFCLFSF